MRARSALNAIATNRNPSWAFALPMAVLAAPSTRARLLRTGSLTTRFGYLAGMALSARLCFLPRSLQIESLLGKSYRGLEWLVRLLPFEVLLVRPCRWKDWLVRLLQLEVLLLRSYRWKEWLVRLRQIEVFLGKSYRWKD